ncbi:hypothetical protein [Maledivibacter halophilus]|uniref:Uncharacterized protein n=1 Tax=Maledivibacter halophilus TaxID=36842 RepID=A0A1T5MI62_9FIRM|nr:hypothetical protein [Maledivibacter halophilus]SKC87608.1 hypothetical protein SAMN02194393_04717 [Maledivibacter halophilus]
MNKREKSYLVVILLLIGALTFKSFYLDEYNPVTKDEKLFKEYAENLADEKYKGFLMDKKLASFRIVSIKKLDDEGISIIEIKNGNNSNYKEIQIKGKYRAKIRKYLFHFLPYREDKVFSRK